MSWSFHILNGDLNLGGPGGFATVSGTQKLIQDLKHWFLEPIGTDPMHPDYGSAFEGGVMPDGTQIEPQIGTVITGEALLAVESEVRRVLYAYQDQQLQRLNREAVLYSGKNTFAAGEILLSVDDVKVEQVADVVLATISLTTQSGNAVSFVTPIT